MHGSKKQEDAIRFRIILTSFIDLGTTWTMDYIRTAIFSVSYFSSVSANATISAALQQIQGGLASVPFWRTDIYGNDLVGAVKNSFEKMGGRFVDGVGYTPHTGDLSARLNRINFIIWDQELRALEAKLKNAVSIYGINKVGIYLVSF